jgi:ubiquitin-conjugating enzyme E2 M
MSTVPSRNPSPLCLSRIQKDLTEITPEAFPGISVRFPDPKVTQVLMVRVCPFAGLWAKHNFDFKFTIPDDFPFERPSVRCETRIWHPNIEETGGVCLNILRDNYTPVMSLGHLLTGLQFLFTEPNPLSPLNNEASEQFTKKPQEFKQKAQEYMRLYCPKN